jgi:hypothetical protein
LGRTLVYWKLKIFDKFVPIKLFSVKLTNGFH